VPNDLENSAYDYLSWGNWGTGLVATPEQEVHASSRWIAGALTSDAAMSNKTGKAKYTGWLEGTRASITDRKDSPSGHQNRDQFVRGSITLDADFGTKKMSGKLSFQQQSHGIVFPGTAVTANFSGKMSDTNSQFSGSLSGSDIKGGKLNGAFYGPEAKEMGGNWKMEAEKWQATGIFAGKEVEKKK